MNMPENEKLLMDEIGMSEGDFGRFRGAFLDDEYGDYICISTRIGGDNRECYEDTIDNIRGNEYFVFDEDDDTDSSYAYFYFCRRRFE